MIASRIFLQSGTTGLTACLAAPPMHRLGPGGCRAPRASPQSVPRRDPASVRCSPGVSSTKRHQLNRGCKVATMPADTPRGKSSPRLGRSGVGEAQGSSGEGLSTPHLSTTRLAVAAGSSEGEGAGVSLRPAAPHAAGLPSIDMPAAPPAFLFELGRVLRLVLGPKKAKMVLLSFLMPGWNATRQQQHHILPHM